MTVAPLWLTVAFQPLTRPWPAAAVQVSTHGSTAVEPVLVTVTDAVKPPDHALSTR